MNRRETTPQDVVALIGAMAIIGGWGFILLVGWWLV